jgi:hypothetical protein
MGVQKRTASFKEVAPLLEIVDGIAKLDPYAFENGRAAA